MTKDITLLTKKREPKDKAELGWIPAVLYGRGVDNVSVWVSLKDFTNLYTEIGESTIFKLALDDKDMRNVIIKDNQKDLISGKFRHIDFYQVNMAEEIEADIELNFIGETKAVKELGGVLVKNMDEIPVKCFPADLPSEFTVDISVIKSFDDYIYVKDLKISDKIEVLIDPENVVAMVAPPRTEQEMADLDTEVKEDVTKVEGVVKEEKTEEGEEKKAE